MSHLPSEIVFTCGNRSVRVNPALLDELGLEAYGRGSTTRGILRDLNLLQDDRALSANAKAVRNLLEENFPEPFTWR